MKQQNFRPITKQELKDLIAKDDPLILECGSNDGSDTAEFLDTLPNAKVHCYEPDPRPINRFLDRMRHYSGWTLTTTAINRYTGITTLHLSSGSNPNQETSSVIKVWDRSSSILKPTGHIQKFPWCYFTQSIQVPCHRLDDLINSNQLKQGIDLIWADVQGAEFNLIHGAFRTLLRTHFLFTEIVSTTGPHANLPMYEEQFTLPTLQHRLGTHWSLLGTFGDESQQFNAILQNNAYKKA